MAEIKEQSGPFAGVEREELSAWLANPVTAKFRLAISEAKQECEKGALSAVLSPEGSVIWDPKHFDLMRYKLSGTYAALCSVSGLFVEGERHAKGQ